MMRIKLARGPMANKRVVTQDDSTYDYIVQEPRKRAWDYDSWDYSRPMDMAFDYRRGSYHKSNVRLKDGTWVFEWMGWKE